MSEPVAWRHRIEMQNLWGYSENKSDCEFLIKQSGVKKFELEPLFAAPQAGIGWQPIETADKSQEIIGLSSQENQRIYMLRWFKYNGREAWRDWDGDPHEPTHWLPVPPLPPSPKPESNEK